MNSLVSICIPAFEQPDLLIRCLQSIALQKYPHIEVIVTDDSESEAVKLVCNEFASQLSMNYYKNIPALGSPANWNSALSKAKGQYRLLLHHDDWLATENSLLEYVNAFMQNPDVDGVFGQTIATVKEGVQGVQHVKLSAIHKKPMLLLEQNKVGPPSNLMISDRVKEQYDVQYKWLVDIDYYIRVLMSGHKLHFIPKILIGVGVHPGQTTNTFMQHPFLVLEEYLAFAHSYASNLEGWKLYDRYWRLVRNSGVAHHPDLHSKLSSRPVPPFINRIIDVQKNWPQSWLSFGLISKALMWGNYLRSGFR